MGLTTYQFGTITDPQNVWTNEANLADSNDSTQATTSTNKSGSNNYVHLKQPSSLANSGLIGSVRIRLAGTSTAGSPNYEVNVYSDQAETNSLYVNNHALVSGTDVIINLPAPTDSGWTWGDVANIAVKIGQVSGGTGGIGTCELQVQTFAYAFPIMMGVHSSLPAATSQRTIPVNAGIDSLWSTTVKTGETCAPCDLVFRGIHVVTDVAPGNAGESIFLNKAGNTQFGSVNPVATLGAAATSADDWRKTLCVSAGETARIERSWSSLPTNAFAKEQMLTYVLADSFPLFASSSGNVGVNSTVFVAVQDSGAATATTNIRANVMPIAGTISKLYVKKLEAALTSGTYTITLQKNGVDTALTVTFGAGDTLKSDTSHSISVSAGDTVVWKIVGASASVTSAFAIGACFDSTTPGYGLLLGGNGTAIATGPNYHNWHSAGAWEATESNAQAFGGHCEVTDIYVLLGQSPGASVGSGKSRTITFRKGAANTALAVTITDTATTGSFSTTGVFLDDGDLVDVKSDGAGTPLSSTVRYGIAFRAPKYDRTLSTEQEGLTDASFPYNVDYKRNPTTEQESLTDDVSYVKGAPPPVNWTRTITDNAALSDRAFYNPKKISDALGLTDSGSVDVSTAEPSSLSDTLAVSHGWNIVITDNLTAHDPVQVAIPHRTEVTLSDDLGMLDHVFVPTFRTWEPGPIPF